MKIALIAGSLTTLAAASSFAGEQTIEGVGLGREITCTSGDVGIYGAENTIKLVGDCGHVTIHGVSHTVTFEKARQLSISGTNNTVSGGATQNLVVEVSNNEVTATLKDDAEPSSLAVSGAENIVNVKVDGPSQFDVSGANHQVTWSLAGGSTEPTISISGADNDVTKAE
ncbi:MULTISPECIES: DUF3060 domain-containing protein [unclassified Ochrobactrum]|uniref:DUF3060 domain-containing protein n=1 Tax=unclassified Ochrobactrum TaxID=239106 RepID=UPI000DF0150E|nr:MULTISPECIES: DUF3060 domain-containing protein [unclassified Ochrobactrum]MBQ0707394.1 DUF3060 domain-containing protein [Ochrobactrum sp. AP1BH01-1]